MEVGKHIECGYHTVCCLVSIETNWLRAFGADIDISRLAGSVIGGTGGAPTIEFKLFS